MEEELETSEDELQQMRKLNEFRRLVTAILLRRIPLLVIVFAIVFMMAAVIVWYHTKTSLDRFEAQTHLVFYPKESPGINPLDNDQVMRLLSRRVMAIRVAAELGIPAEAADELSGCFEVFQDAKSRNFYAVKAIGSTEEIAVRRVNAFADSAIKEYCAYRLEDLRTRRESIERRKAEIAAESARIDAEEQAMNDELALSSPAQECDRLTKEIALKKSQLSETMLHIGDAESRLKDAQARLGGANPAILDEADTVRRFTSKLEKCDAEIEELSIIYTDANPKLLRAHAEREAIAKRYEEFLASFGMKMMNESALARIDSLGAKAKEAMLELERYEATRRAMERDIDENQAKLTALIRVLPRYESFRTRRETLNAGRKNIDESDADVRFLEATVKSELAQLERAISANGKGAFSKKKLIAMVAVATIATGCLALFFFCLELLRGTILDEKELSFYADAETVGIFGAGSDSDSDAFIRFRHAFGEGKKLFITPIKGCDPEQTFIQCFLLQCSLAGLKVIIIDIVRAHDYVPDDNDVMFTTVAYRGDRGKMPVIDTAGMSSMEITMLEADLAMLLSDFDLVVIKGPQPFSGSILDEQLAQICDARLALVAPGKSHRADYRTYLDKKTKISLSVAVRSLLAAFMLGVTFATAGCYPGRFTGNYCEFPELYDDDESAIVDESGLSETERDERDLFLRNLGDQPPEVYRINAGDKIRLMVYDHPDISSETTVTPDGHVGVVFLGQVKIAGLTIPEASAKIQSGLDKYLKKPAVGITPLEISSQSATIAGAVAKPGIYPISSDMRLADLFATSGGSSVRLINGQEMDAADMDHSYIFRDGKALPVDFNRAIYGGDRYHNVRLMKNDYVYIGVRAESMVCIVGHVKKPHQRLYTRNLTLIEVLTAADWVDESYWPNVIIIRGGVSNPRLYKVDVDAILAGRRANVKLCAGDIVYVPHDNISEYNVFIRKALPTGQLFNMLVSPLNFWSQQNSTTTK